MCGYVWVLGGGLKGVEKADATTSTVISGVELPIDESYDQCDIDQSDQNNELHVVTLKDGRKVI